VTRSWGKKEKITQAQSKAEVEEKQVRTLGWESGPPLKGRRREKEHFTQKNTGKEEKV